MTVPALPRPRPDDDRGVVAVVVAASLAVFLGLAAIVVDLGNARDLQRQTQNAADAGALGAAQFMAATLAADPAAAVAKGRSYVTSNGGDGAMSSVSVDVAAGTVDVTLAPRHAPGFFSGAVGGGTPTVGASARASWHGGANLACALCVRGDYDGGAGSAEVAGGNVAINGSLSFTGLRGSLSVAPPGTVGYLLPSTVGGGVTPAPVPLSAAVPDPLSWLPLPPPAADPGVVAKIGTGSCAPGVYADVTACTAFTGGGTYVLTGSAGTRTIEINADARDSLFYVSCYATGPAPPRETHYAPCGSGVPPAHLFGAGRADVTVTARASGPYQGFGIVFDRGMVCTYPACQQSLLGNRQLTVNGVVYGPSIPFAAAGNGSFTGHGTVVVGAVHLNGAGSQPPHITVDASPAAGVPVPAAPVRLTR